MLEMEDRRISKELHSDEQSDYRSRLPFTTACAINSTKRLHQEENQVSKCINLPSDLTSVPGRLMYTWYCSTCSCYNFSLHFCTVISCTCQDVLSSSGVLKSWGRLNACAHSVYQALLRFSRAPGTRLYTGCRVLILSENSYPGCL